MKSIADIIADAREFLEHHTWLKGTIGTPETGVCARGAICYSQGWNPNILTREEITTLKTVETLVVQADGRGFDYVPRWNDSNHTTRQMVLDAFAKAEKIERAGFDPDAA